MPIQVKINRAIHIAKPWHRMPKQGRYFAVPIKVNGAPSEAQLTEGGVPVMKYSYFRLRGQIYYVKGHVGDNAEVTA